MKWVDPAGQSAPGTPDYNAVSLIIVAAAVVVKILLGRYVKGVGRRVNSDSLINSGEDATLDSVISASTLAAAGIFLVFHVSLEAWLGAVISLVIIKSGVEMLRDTISQILGEQNDPELARSIKQTVAGFDAKDRRAVFADAVAAVREAFPDYELQAAMDTDFAEE